MTSHWQAWLYLAAVLILLAAFAIQALLGRWLKDRCAAIATGAISASVLLGLIGFLAFLPHLGGGRGHTSGLLAPPFSWSIEHEWISVDLVPHAGQAAPDRSRGLRIPFSVRIDALTVLMFFMVSLVATLVHVYSLRYMEGDRDYPRYFALLSLFCASMLALILFDSLFLVFVCWELVGFSSYLLIGFWFEKPGVAGAASKAFIVNRVGDFGMLVGLGILWSTLGTFSISEINAQLSSPDLRDAHLRLTRLTATQSDPDGLVQFAGSEDAGTTGLSYRPLKYWLLSIAGLGIFAGCVGKSAQFPLHVWLPDAMAGPTPVSALIHAATMVAAGVYLVGRFYPLFSHEVLIGIAYVGAITHVIGATASLVQTDYKKALAYTTMSQLGFMMLGLGAGGWAAGLFHLMTHAFYKALLFLAAGSIYRSVHTYDLSRLGGLKSRMPITAWTMLIGVFAAAGLPFVSGFYSKDAVLASLLRFQKYYSGHDLLLVAVLLGALLSAIAIFRLWFLIFDGEPRDQSLISGAKESPRMMTRPLVLLAVLTVFCGYPVTVLPIATPVLETWIEAAQPLTVTLGHASEPRYLAIGLSILISLIGTGISVLLYSRWRFWNLTAPERHLGMIRDFFMNAWYFDKIYQWIVIRPVMELARFTSKMDQVGLDSLPGELVRVTRKVSVFSDILDRWVVDGVVRLVGWLLYYLGRLGLVVQTGRIRSYVTLMALALLVLFVCVYAWVR